MAGGASNPRLAAAVAAAGGLGFLAAGYKTSEAMYQEIRQLRDLTSQPFGVNLFMPQPRTVGPVRRRGLRRAARRRGRLVRHRARRPGRRRRTTRYDAKVAVLLEDPVPMVSFTFGCPDRPVLDAFAAAGTYTRRHRHLRRRGAGRRSGRARTRCASRASRPAATRAPTATTPQRDGAGTGLLALIPQVREAVELPVIAAGGLMRGCQIAAVLAAGAAAAALGTAFLVCPESGAHALHKRAITDPVFARTELTRAFSGRPARGLVNRFMREHGRYAPPGYPQVHHLTQPLRKAAAAPRRPAGHVAVGGPGPPAGPRAVRRRPRRDPRRRTRRRPGGPPHDGTRLPRRAPAPWTAPRPRSSSTAPEGRHAVSVRRLRAGEEVVLTDGAGARRPGRGVRPSTGKDELTVEVRASRSEPEPEVAASPSCRRCPRATGANWPSRP